jgi:hypothetical protein
VLGVSRADDANHALALDHLAVLTDWLDAAAYFHKELLWTCTSPTAAVFAGGLGISGISELALENTEAFRASQLAGIA